MDKIKKFLAYNGKVSVICAETTNMVEEARKTHDLSPVVTAALGRMITITAIMGADLKDVKDKITVQINSDGPIGSMLAVSTNFPKVKAYVKNPCVDLPLNEKRKAVGANGFLNIIKDIGLKNPYVGTVPLVSGEIAEDFTNYFAVSEQKPTVVALGVLVNKDGVLASGGYVITLMPDATEEEIEKIENAIKNVKPISKMLEEKMQIEDIAKLVSGDDNIKLIEDNIIPVYECDCSKEKMEKGFITIGKEEMTKILNEDGKAELVCHFCNKKYNFTKEEIKDLIEKM